MPQRIWHRLVLFGRGGGIAAGVAAQRGMMRLACRRAFVCSHTVYHICTRTQANALLEEYKKSVSGLKPARKMSREEGSHHDTLIDDWDIA